MNARLHSGPLAITSALRWSEAFIVLASLALGCVLALTIASPRALLCAIIGAVAVGAFLLYPEFALAAYVVVGDVKGNESVASLLSVDLTLAMGAILLAGIALNLIRGREPLRPPAIYFAFVALIVMMAASLVRTPNFAAGLNTFVRFLSVTGIVIVAPFLVLNTAKAMKRFLIGFSAATFLICGWSLLNLGGIHRLVSPSDNTIGLGHIACALFALLWVGVICRYPFPRRALAYPLIVVPALALVGSASRGSLIACLLIIAISLIFNRKLLLDVSCLAVIGLATLPFIGIPANSLSYLGSLARSQSVGDLLNFRADLLEYGWRLLLQHPVFGAGLAGFRYLSPNPTLYKWPHNIFLELACDLGIPAALLVLGIFCSAIRSAVLQLRDKLSPHPSFSRITAALLLVGLVNAVNTGNINSDRSTWLFVSLVFVAAALRACQRYQVQIRIPEPVES